MLPVLLTIGLTGFGLSAAINSGIALVVFSIFCYARRQPLNKFVYAPRTLHPAFRQGRPAPPPISSSFFGFIMDVIRVPRSTYIACAGLDSYMFLRWMELCMALFGGMTVLGVAILVPVNYTAHGGVDGFESISMSNIPENSARLAAHILVAYCFAAWLYYLLYRLWMEYAELRRAHMAREALSNRGLSLLVQSIPPSARNDASFLSTFRSFFPQPSSSAAVPLMSPTSQRLLTEDDQQSTSAIPHFIHSAYVAKDTGKMSDAIEERDKHLNGLEHAVLTYQNNPDERPMTATTAFLFNKKDALTWHEEQMVKQDAVLKDEKAKVEAAKEGWSNGFITFDTVVAYQSAVRVDKTSEPFSWSCRPAPELRDVYWPSLSYTATKRLYMGVIVAILLWLLVFFWIIPITFVQGIANLSNLPDKLGSGFNWVNSIPSVPLGIINGFLPGLVLTIFNIVLPMILYKLSKMQGIEALSWLQASVIRKFSIFQIVNNFFFTTASTAILAQLTSIVNDPTSIVNILGQTIPTTATFFITYLLFTTLAVYPMALLNPGGLIVGRLKKKFLVKTPRDLIAVEAAPPRDYGTSYPITLFTFIIAITFSVIASISLPFATLYFAFGWFVNKYNGLYVYNTHFETGGQLWPTVFQMMTWCVFVGQAVFTALLGIKKATGPAIVSAPLVIAPWVFYYVILRAFKRTTEVLPAKTAVLVDVEREKRRVKRVKGLHSTAFLDEWSALHDFNYDVYELRARRQDDLINQHNECMQERTEQYHKAVFKAQQSGQANGNAHVVEDGDERKDQRPSNASSAPPIPARQPLSVVVDDGATGSGSSSHEGSVVRTTQGRGSSSGNGVEPGVVGFFHSPPSSSPSLLDVTLGNGEALGALPPPVDYIQPELVSLPHLPIPRSIPAVAPLDSIEQSPRLYEELSTDALERHAQGGQADKAGAAKKVVRAGQDGDRTEEANSYNSPA